jgi:hypothetical protein
VKVLKDKISSIKENFRKKEWVQERIIDVILDLFSIVVGLGMGYYIISFVYI